MPSHKHTPTTEHDHEVLPASPDYQPPPGKRNASHGYFAGGTAPVQRKAGPQTNADPGPASMASAFWFCNSPAQGAVQLKKDAPDKFKQTVKGRLVQNQQTNEGLTRVTYRLRGAEEDIDPYWTAFLDGGMALFLPHCQVVVHGREVSFVVDLALDHFAEHDHLVEFKRGKHD